VGGPLHPDRFGYVLGQALPRQASLLHDLPDGPKWEGGGRLSNERLPGVVKQCSRRRGRRTTGLAAFGTSGGEVPLVTGSVKVRARVCVQARGPGAWSVGSRRRAVEDHLRFARSSGAAGESEHVRLEAELPEWQRIEALLDSSEARYEPETDPVAAAAAEEMSRRERAAADAREAARRAERERREGRCGGRRISWTWPRPGSWTPPRSWKRTIRTSGAC
jgi:hypothetical protein